MSQLLTRPTYKTLLATAALATMLVSSGCATSSVLNKGASYTDTQKVVLSTDQIVAFGKPAEMLPRTPNASMVIIGEKKSYVLTEGGTEMINLLSNLDPRYITVKNAMEFEVPNNDGYFEGDMRLSYAKLKEEFSKRDYQYFLQNDGKDCTTDSDNRINAQRFCFDVPVRGAIYPAVSNLNVIRANYRPLSKPYTVSFYTNKQDVRNNSKTTADKLILLPFALAFDVVTLPLQILEKAAD
ncbi:hypothetical protein [Psychrobacter aestuarii]|uniref:Lipoprotein n=1 Tax=Psychrobacter aestuarii TaxID=556327 RepID=A0ABN0VKR2_9GAMM|nr:hypothetical protein [Psychrobacter aestuarii]